MTRYVPRLVPLAFAPMHRRWDEIVGELENENPLTVIQAHRNSAKSTFWEIGYVLYRLCIWLWLRRQGQPRDDERGLILGPTQPDAEASLRQVRHELETNPLILKDFRPEQGKPWSDSAFSFKGAGDVKNPTLRADSLTGIRPGPRLTFVVAGDVVQPKHVYSKLQRDKDMGALTEVVQPMIVKDGVCIVNGTTYHSDDLLARLVKDPSWHCERFPLVLNKDEQKVSWPERFSWTQVEQLMKKPIVFSRQYQLVEIAAEDRLLPMPEHWDSKRLEKRDGIWRIDGDPIRIVAGVDPGFKERQVASGARTAVVVLGFKRNHEIYLIDVRCGHWGPDKVWDAIVAVHAAWHTEAVFIEEVAFSAVFRSFLVKHTNVPARPSKAIGDKIERIVGTLNAPMSNHKIKIINEGRFPESQPEEATREQAEFPGETVDIIDAMEHGVRAIETLPAFAMGARRGGLIHGARQAAEGAGASWIRTDYE